MGIGLKDIIKDDKDALVRDKQKRTMKMLLLAMAVLAVLILFVIILIISNMIKTKGAERVTLIARDVANISSYIKGIGQQYLSNNYEGELVGTPLDNSAIVLDEKGKAIEYKYGYCYITADEMSKLMTSLNVSGEDYIVNYLNGDVANVKGVRATDGKTYYAMEDIIAVANKQTPKNVIYIHNANEMKWLYQYPNGTFYLSNDIDMSGYSAAEGWEPVAKFGGEFNGRGYTISNLSVNRPTSSYCGLFGEITSSAEIKNINFSQVNVRGGNYTGTLAGSCSANISNVTITDGQVNSQERYVGGLVGAYDKGTITDCKVRNVSVNATGTVGGLVGTLLSGSVQRSGVDATVTGIESAGGLIGDVRPNSSTTIKEVFANTRITAQTDVGGLIGTIQIINRSLFDLNNSYSEGVINGGKQNVGGAIGRLYAANNPEINIQSIYTATDTPASATLRGGFAGRTNIEEGTSTQVLKCYYEKDPLLDLNVGDVGLKEGIVVVVDSKTPAEMKTRVTYSDWNFDIWTLEEGINRPHLRWEYEIYEPKIEEKK